MLRPFTIEQPTRIAFGAGRLGELAAEVAALAGPGARVLLVADRGVERAGLVERAREALAGLEAGVHACLAGEPAAADVDEVATIARERRADVVVALGGGSALDLGKLAASVAPAAALAAAYALMARPLPAGPLPVICIPTTAGTGAEVTRTAVFTDGRGRKVWAWGDGLRPRTALLDPTLTVGLPAPVTIASGLDALVHAIEAATSRRRTPVSDASALHAIRLILAHLPRAVAGPEDLQARAAMLIAACLAGLAIDTAGTGIGHALGHALGTLAKVPHGRAVALSLRVALAGNAAAAPEAHRAVAEAMRLGAPDEADPAQALAGRFDALVRALGLDVSLAVDGLGPADATRLLDAVLAPENRPMLDANPRRLERADLAAVVERLLAA